MMATPENKLPLKVMIDIKRNEVIFAEAGRDLVDVLLSFLTLPLGTIIRRLNQHFGDNTNGLGCFNNLYSSINKFTDSDFVSKEDRHVLLHPKNVSQSEFLKLKVDDSQVVKYQKCSHCSTLMIIGYIDYCYCCGLPFTSPVRVFSSSNVRAFTDSTKSFIITDDLRLMPGLDGSNFEQLQNLAIDVDEFEEKTINVGLNEIMHLLKWSLLSPTPLTNMLLLHSKFDHLKPSNAGTLPPNHEIANQTEDSRKMVIKALLQKSTNKLLFFLVGDDFVEFLFRLLAIPLGSVASLLCGSTGLGSIDNLYSSIQRLSLLYLASPKKYLVNPKVVHYSSNKVIKILSFNPKSHTPGSNLMDLISANRLVKGTSMFMVTDDLNVTPLTSISIFSHLKSCKIPISDVKELPYNIGTKEALDILKATLTSTTSVLSNALKLMKEPKQEK